MVIPNEPIVEHKLPQEEGNKILAVISYFGFLCFIPLFLKKSNHYVQFHAKQGLVLFIAEVILSFVNIIPILGQLTWFVAVIVFFIVSIRGAIKAWNGVYWKIPVISEYAKKINLD